MVKKLWSEMEEFDFEGTFYKVKEGMSMPKPLQQSPSIPIMSAGGSPRGRRFACEHADMCFVMLKSDKLADCRKQIDEYKDYAMGEFGRKVQVWTYAPVVQRETHKEAEDYLQYFAVDKSRQRKRGRLDGRAARADADHVKGGAAGVPHPLRRRRRRLHSAGHGG
jgi:alkanesulfonate monooxygenase SsuD/methylene tetrahydromethanopterin reductase-like flavin-dependent oxidoreductase (luciferase family)